MDFSNRLPGQFDEAAALADWPKAYYEEKSATKRLALLDSAISANADPEGDRLRKQLFDRRYVPDENAADGYVDNFFRCFMNISMITKNKPTPFGMKRAKADILKNLETTGLFEKTENQALFDSILLREFCHMAQLYIALSADSREYRSFIMGFGRINDDALVIKLHTDLASAGIDAARMFDLYDEMKLWLRGIDEARARMLPDTDSLL